MKKNNFLYLALISVSLLLLSSCFGIKGNRSNSGSPNKLYENFYLGDGVTQYFVKPLSLENNISDDHSFDFIYRKGEDTLSLASINLTIFNAEIISDNEKIKLNSGSLSSQASDIKVLFTEKRDELFKNRISFKIPYNELVKILNDKDNFNIEINTNSEILKLTLSKKSIKDLDKLNTILF